MVQKVLIKPTEMHILILGYVKGWFLLWRL